MLAGARARRTARSRVCCAALRCRPERRPPQGQQGPGRAELPARAKESLRPSLGPSEYVAIGMGTGRHHVPAENAAPMNWSRPSKPPRRLTLTAAAWCSRLKGLAHLRSRPGHDSASVAGPPARQRPTDRARNPSVAGLGGVQCAGETVAGEFVALTPREDERSNAT